MNSYSNKSNRKYNNKSYRNNHNNRKKYNKNQNRKNVLIDSLNNYLSSYIEKANNSSNYKR